MRTPNLGYVLRTAVEAGKASLRVAMPGRIVSFDASTQLAEVKPLFHDVSENEDFEVVTATLPNLVDVPVIFPGGGDYLVTTPVSAGDTCQLLINDQALDYFISNGTDGAFIDERYHDISDAVAIVGLRSLKNKISEFDNNRAVFGKKGAPRVACGTDVQLGVTHNEQATEQVILGTGYVQVEVTQLNQAAAALTAAGSAMSTLAGAAAAPPLSPLGAGFAAAAAALTQASAAFSTLASQIPSKLSTKVKVK